MSDASDSTFLCHACTTATAKGKIIVLSIAAGVDYGDARRLNLPALTVVEKAVLASGRTYFLNITLTASGGSVGYCSERPRRPLFKRLARRVVCAHGCHGRRVVGGDGCRGLARLRELRAAAD